MTNATRNSEAMINCYCEWCLAPSLTSHMKTFVMLDVVGRIHLAYLKFFSYAHYHDFTAILYFYVIFMYLWP